jgi:DNA-directed RNA polymerase specialized sigma24 family protein
MGRARAGVAVVTLAEALAQLQEHPRDGDAGATILAELQALSRRQGVVPQHREEALLDVQLKVLNLIGAGRFETVPSPRGFIFTMLKRRSIDLWRKAKRRREAQDRIPAPQAPDAPPPPAPDGPRLRELFQKALSRRQERYRPPLQQAWDDLLRVLAGATLADALGERGGEVTAASLNRAYKAQERLRSALLDVIEYRSKVGSFNPDDADVYRREVMLLVRCQGRGLGRVSKDEVTDE